MINRITLESLDEQYAPPTEEIDIALVGDALCIAVYEGSDNDLMKGRTKKFDVPALDVQDVLGSLFILMESEIRGGN
jgi:hypothetical protein